MFLLEPNRTPYDLNFYVGDIHVRVHPLFWVMALLIGGLGPGGIGINVVLGVLIVFVSLLVHELGHAFTMKFYGEHARVVLYMMGGFATSQGSSIWEMSSMRRDKRSPLRQIIISFAGPAAGFALAAMVVAVMHFAGGRVQFFFLPQAFYLPQWNVEPPPGRVFPPAAFFSIHILLFCNIYWGILNLMPVYPLDGGQIARQVCLLRDPYEGLTQSLWISVFVGGAVAVLGLMRGQIMLTIMFGSLAYSSYQALQQYGGGRRW